MKRPEASRLGRMILADLAVGIVESASFRVVCDALCRKVTKTLLAWSGSFCSISSSAEAPEFPLCP